MKVASTMGGDSMVIETPLTKSFEMSTEPLGLSFKNHGTNLKNHGTNLKSLTPVTIEEHGPAGAAGDYTVTVTGGKEIPIRGAITIRVLDHGELNLVTDAGRWYLFAPQTWQTAFPTQPTPGNSADKS